LFYYAIRDFFFIFAPLTVSEAFDIRLVSKRICTYVLYVCKTMYV